MTTTKRVAVALAGAALTGAGVHYLGGGSWLAAAGGAIADFIVLFVKLRSVEA